MKYSYDIFGNTIERELEQLSSVSNRLFHVTPKENKNSILENGILIGQPAFKSIADHKAIFLTDLGESPNTSGLFRWDDELYCLIVIDSTKLTDIQLFRDIFMEKEAEMKGISNNHIMCFQSIPKEAITEVIEY